jgi:SprT protein
MLVWEKYGRKVRPHGPAWKNQYAMMLGKLLEKKIFPPEIEQIIIRQVINPKASSKCDTLLTRALQPHNDLQHGVFLEDLPHDTVFSMQNGRKFQKKEKLRKWYRCLSLDNRKLYRVSPVARVIPERD